VISSSTNIETNKKDVQSTLTRGAPKCSFLALLARTAVDTIYILLKVPPRRIWEPTPPLGTVKVVLRANFSVTMLVQGQCWLKVNVLLVGKQVEEPVFGFYLTESGSELIIGGRDSSRVT
jgi:hypothetical protein